MTLESAHTHTHTPVDSVPVVILMADYLEWNQNPGVSAGAQWNSTPDRTPVAPGLLQVERLSLPSPS